MTLQRVVPGAVVPYRVRVPDGEIRELLVVPLCRVTALGHQGDQYPVRLDDGAGRAIDELFLDQRPFLRVPVLCGLRQRADVEIRMTFHARRKVAFRLPRTLVFLDGPVVFGPERLTQAPPALLGDDEPGGRAHHQDGGDDDDDDQPRGHRYLSSGYLPVNPRQAVDAPAFISGNPCGTRTFGS